VGGLAAYQSILACDNPQGLEWDWGTIWRSIISCGWAMPFAGHRSRGYVCMVLQTFFHP